MLRAIIFDLDQTLIDFMGMKRKCCSAAMRAMIKAGLGIEYKKGLELLYKLYDKYGIEYKLIFQEFLKKVKKGIDYRVLAAGIVAYRKARVLEPYPGVAPVLKKLRKSYKLAILTDAPAVKAWIRLETMGIADLFDIVVCFDDTGMKKPHMQPFQKVLAKLGLKAEQCLIVGDDIKRDIRGGKAVGMRTCFARYGSEKKIKSSGADYEINKIEDLLKVVGG